VAAAIRGVAEAILRTRREEGVGILRSLPVVS
jgi:hypothetical protein